MFGLQLSDDETICSQPQAPSSEIVDPHVKRIAFHFACITFIIPAGKSDHFGLFQSVLNYSTNVGSR
jgi:hypothetical protein